jgi:hypothetical protein
MRLACRRHATVRARTVWAGPPEVSLRVPLLREVTPWGSGHPGSGDDSGSSQWSRRRQPAVFTASLSRRGQRCLTASSESRNAAIDSASGSIGNLRLDQFGQKSEGLLPAKIAGLGRDEVGNPFLSDVDLGSARHLF